MSKKIIKKNLQARIALGKQAKEDVISAEILKTEKHGFLEAEENEKTYEISQSEIKRNVNLLSAEKAFDLDLDSGPFKTKFTRNGRCSLIYNGKGLISSFDVKFLTPNFEIQIDSQINDAIYLHNELYVAVAQEKNIFIYNKQGVEVHCIRENRNAKILEFLPYHFLLCSVCSDGFLRYQDTSTGKMVAEVFIKEKEVGAFKQNFSNAILHVGDRRGLVTLWSPNSKEYLMKVLCHRNKVTGIEIDKSGNYMVTTALDNKVKVWDIRNTYKHLNDIKTKYNTSNMSLSQTNIISLGYKNKIAIHKNIFNNNQNNETLYMQHNLQNQIISSLQFCPYEDILTIGHDKGISYIIVPGSGDPYFDSFEESPFQTKKERQEIEVRRLLEKIPYDMIRLDSEIDFIKEKEVLDKPQEPPKRYFNQPKENRSALSRFFEAGKQ